MTTAGDGYPRRAFKADEIFRMQECGIIDEDENFELIEGDLVMMRSKNAPHERFKLTLMRALAKTLPDDLQLGVETSLLLDAYTILEPDLSVFPMMDSTSARGADVLLAVEIADTTLRRDLKLKRGAVCALRRAGTLGRRYQQVADDDPSRAARRRLGRRRNGPDGCRAEPSERARLRRQARGHLGRSIPPRAADSPAWR